jgi:hypothetical protein
MMKADYGLLTPPMGGGGATIEADETYIGRKPGMKIKAGAWHKHAVLCLVERDGSVRSFHVPNSLDLAGIVQDGRCLISVSAVPPPHC